MGLLDDAIREHLDLKRRRGADPSELARQEHEALGPIRRGDEDAADAETEGAGGGAAAAVADAPPPSSEPSGAVSLARAADEDEDVEWSDPPATAAAAPEGDAVAEEHREDVLEETPEFLEDAPEHDRLWFEQRPPRDFDFDR